jgi:hypothetical protein
VISNFLTFNSQLFLWSVLLKSILEASISPKFSEAPPSRAENGDFEILNCLSNSSIARGWSVLLKLRLDSSSIFPKFSEGSAPYGQTSCDFEIPYL